MSGVTEVGSSSSYPKFPDSKQRARSQSFGDKIKFFETVKPISRKNSGNPPKDPFPSPRIPIPQSNSPRSDKSSPRSRAGSPRLPSSPKHVETFPPVARYFNDGENLSDKLNEIFDILSKKREDGSLVRKESDQLLQRDGEGHFYWDTHKGKSTPVQPIKVILDLVGVALDFGISQFMRNGENEAIEINRIVDKLLENESAKEVINANSDLKRMAFKILVKSIQGSVVNRNVNELLKLFDPETNIWEALALIFFALGEEQRECVKALLRRKKESSVEIEDIDLLFEELGLDTNSSEQEKQEEFHRLLNNPSVIVGFDGYAKDNYERYFKEMYEKKLSGYTQKYLALIQKPLDLEGIEDLKQLYDNCELDEFIRKFMRPSNNAIKSLMEGLPVVFSHLLKRSSLFLKKKKLAGKSLEEKLRELRGFLKKPIQWERVGNTVRFFAALIGDYYLNDFEVARKLCYPFLNDKPCKNKNVYQLPAMRISLTMAKPDSPPLPIDNLLSNS